MQVKDLMRTEVLTVGEDEPLPAVIDLFLREHIHGVPVLGDGDELVGVLTQQDLFFASATRTGDQRDQVHLVARDMMTSPAVSVTEQTGVRDLCQLMCRLRIHRVPVVRDGKLVGIVSSLDVCGAHGAGKLG